jgi:hypothetical protein
MNAVRGSIAALGGTATVDLIGAERDGHRAFELVLEWPRAAVMRAA